MSTVASPSASALFPQGLPSSGYLARRLPLALQDLLRKGGRVVLQDILAQYPDLEEQPGIVMNLAYEEFTQRVQAGETFDLDAFGARFPALNEQFRQLVNLHFYMEDNPHCLPLGWPQPGQQFLGFSIKEELGRGGFARVFLATEPALGNRPVAVKVAVQGSGEAQILGRLSHPNIVPVYSIQEDKASGFTVICMPYLGKATLEDVLHRVYPLPEPPLQAPVILEAIQRAAPAAAATAERRPAPRWLRRGTYVDAILAIGVQLADALAFVHAAGLCHGDLKPSNVLLGADGRPMLLDFNQVFEPEGVDTQDCGTLPYMAPEQLLARKRKNAAGAAPVDARSDLFALGIILYELLTGQYPFGPVSLQVTEVELRSLLLERQRRGAPALRQVNPRVNPALAQLVHRCLAYDPNDRPASAAAVVAQLRKCLSWPSRVRRWLGQHPRSMIAAALLLVTTSVGLGYAWSVQPPYSQRQWQHGQQAYRQGQYEQAVEYFTQALQADPQLDSARFDRGRAYQHMGKLDLALIDLEAVLERHSDGRVLAFQGYCKNQCSLHPSAIRHYQLALKADFATAEVYNNLGYSCLQLSQLPDAEKYLNEAIQRNGSLQAAFHNRAFVHLRRGMQESKNPMVKLQRYRAAILDMEKTIELGPRTSELNRQAGMVCDVAAKCEELRNDPLLRGLRQKLDLPTALRNPSDPTPPQKAVRLLNPVQD